MKIGDKTIVDYEYLITRQSQFSSLITENQIKDPENKNKEFVEQNLINLGAMNFINELIDKFPTITINQTIEKTK